MHATIPSFFSPIVNMKRVETCVHNKCKRLYGNLTFRFVLFSEHAKLWDIFGSVGLNFFENSSGRKVYCSTKTANTQSTLQVNSFV